MLKKNYHMHTSYCNHASGTAEEIAKVASDAGYETLGFSEHVHLPGRALHPRRTSLVNQVKLIEEVKHLKNKYKDKMETLMGFECELFTDYYDYYNELLDNPDVDYLIIGHHYFEEISRPKAWSNLAEEEKMVTLYVDLAIDAFKTGLFSMMAHPALIFSKKEFSKHDEKESRRLIKEAMKYEIPLGLNLNGYAKQIDGIKPEIKYPVDEFFKIVGELKAEVLIEVDGHKPEHLINTEAMNMANKLIKKYNLNVIKELKLK